jgi:hypothetical protein
MIFMKTTKEYLELLRAYKALKAIQYGILRIGIFGSVSRGEQTPQSDVDIFVELKKPSLFILVHIKDELQELLGCNVDIVRLRQNMDTILRDSITEEGIYA